MSTTARYRDAQIGACLNTEVQQRSDGCLILRAPEPLGTYQPRLCDYLVHWAAQAPERVMIAQRDKSGAWQEVTYRAMLSNVQSIAAHMLSLDLSSERPVAILSGNSIEHLTIALAAAWIGVPSAAISVPYSLISKDFGKLRHVINKLTPGLVFADNAKPFVDAIRAAVPVDTPTLTVNGSVPGHAHHEYASWIASNPSESQQQKLAQAFNAVNGTTILKFLFTSGSTKLPKAVTTTNDMLCANQQMIRQTLTTLSNEPPVLLDWLPWNHVFGGSHNVAIALTNGGSLYIDAGNPSPAGMKKTLANLRDISPTIYFNVPKGFEEIARAMEGDPTLANSLFKRVKCFFFAGAGLSQAVWDQLDRIAEETVGERIPIFTGLGMTETAPSSTFAVQPNLRAGQIGLPCPGVEAKLAPVDGKWEVRFRGPHVMNGYWRDPELSAQAFDDENYYNTGDAVTWADPKDQQQGLMFDGRIAEDFKLSTGTFVSVGPLRTQIIMAGAPIIADVVITGINRDEVGMLVFARLEECAALAKLSDDEKKSPQEILTLPAVTQWLQGLVDQLYQAGTGSANRITRAMLQTDPLSIDLGEVTDKGSINQRAVLTHRAGLIDELYGFDGQTKASDATTKLIVSAQRNV